MLRPPIAQRAAMALCVGGSRPSTSSNRLDDGRAESSASPLTSRIGASARATRSHQGADTVSGRTFSTTAARVCWTRTPVASWTTTAWHSSGSSRSSESTQTE